MLLPDWVLRSPQTLSEALQWWLPLSCRKYSNRKLSRPLLL
jgi:hypothetical protein